MNQNCHILATNLDPSRFGAVALVFHTIRRGFPTANLLVYGNGMSPELAHHTASLCRGVGAQFTNIPKTAHGEWIEQLVAHERNPFWIVDTDIVFFDKVEDWFTGAENDILFSGRLEPEFWEEWTKTQHVARLHPSLMWLNPQALRAQLRGWPKADGMMSSVETNPFRWHMVPYRKLGEVTNYFHDTCAGLYHAHGGTKFHDFQNAAFEHLFCGSYLHLMPNHADKIALHDAIFMRPSLAKGLWVEQQKWYEQHQNKI